MESTISPQTDDGLSGFALFQATTRRSFLCLFIIVTVPSVIGNIAAIYSISRRNCRIFQKTCIISLALSDILSTAAIATININTFVQEAMAWPLGHFLCQFLPMCQMVGVLASSVALTMIAMDRYRNVVHALGKRWDPTPCFCFVATGTVWVLSFAISYPMYSFYKFQTKCNVHFCLMSGEIKESLQKYYIAMVIIIFLPLFSVFLWFYNSIAALVWKHRKPISTIFNKKSTQESTSSEVKTVNHPKTQEEIRVGRKIRTFKIIVALMVVFIVCRLPYFTIQILKTFNTALSTRKEMWYMSFSFMALHIVNCCLNPLLYTFFNVTVQVWRKIESFALEICCFCCSRGEFESFETENPFVIEDFEKRKRSREWENRKRSTVRFKEERY
ncbi:C-C chemokine receptor type 3-like [Zophobas morio]|uniref:C-C chemokine receptor type 3-like n=1 Tax=Zophobas morio TaxID=2755281 RepID=UPI0030830964